MKRRPSLWVTGSLSLAVLPGRLTAAEASSDPPPALAQATPAPAPAQAIPAALAPAPTAPVPAAPAATAPASGSLVLPPGYVWAPVPSPAWLVMLVFVRPPSPVDATRRAMNAVYVEFGGNGLVYSVNYERFLNEDVSARAGVGYLAVGDSTLVGSASASLTTVPLMLNYLGVGRDDHRLELGAGVVILYMSAQTYDGLGSDLGAGLLAAGTGSVGYRYAPLDGGFSFKVAFTPLLGAFGLIPLAGVSLGAGF